MYQSFFGLCTTPFDLNTDPRFLYLSPEHVRAQAYLEYAVLKGDSLVVITGEIGIGKSTLIHELSDRIHKDSDVVVLHHPHANAVEFLQAVVFEWGCNKPAATKTELLSQIRGELAARFTWGTRTTLIIDEAQTLTHDVLEELRMLADEEIQSEKPLSIVLVGQPCLRATLARRDMEQLRQRIRLNFHLSALDEHETKAYIQRRLDVAGAERQTIFESGTIPRIYKYTGGIPRLINVLADLSLTAAWMDKSHFVTTKQVNSAIEELGWVPHAKRMRYLPALPGIEQLRGRVSRTIDRATQHFHYLRKDATRKIKQAVGSVIISLVRLREITWVPFSLWARQKAKPRIVHFYSSAYKTVITERARLFASGKRSMANVLHKVRDPASESKWFNPSVARGIIAGFVIATVITLAIPGPDTPQILEARIVVADAPEILPPDTQQVSLSFQPDEARPLISNMIELFNHKASMVKWLEEDYVWTIGEASTLSRAPVFMNFVPADTTEASGKTREAPRPELELHGLQPASWLLEQSPDRYVIQILAARKLEVVDRFLNTAAADRDIVLYRHQRKHEQWYVLVKSETYPSYRHAKQASQSLPKHVLQAKPWIRPLNHVQADIRKAQELQELHTMM